MPRTGRCERQRRETGTRSPTCTQSSRGPLAPFPDAGRHLAIVIDGRVESTPRIMNTLPGEGIIQGGGMGTGMREKPTRAPIENEANNGLQNQRGTLSMARTSDPHSATSQFFINLSDNKALDHRAPSADGWGYCVFARVTDGMDVVDSIAAAPTTSHGMHQDVPQEEILIERVEVLESQA